MLEEVIIESIGRHILNIGSVIAWTSLLDWAAIGAAGTAGPVDRRLKRRIVGVVLRDAPQRLRLYAAVGGGRTAVNVVGVGNWEERGGEKEEKKGKGF